MLDLQTKLKYNPVSNILWETKPTKKTWTYLPEKTMFFHRYIHIGNFFEPQMPYSISEAIGKHSFEELVENGLKDKFLVKPLDYHQSEHAYVVFDDNYAEATSIIKNYLKAIELFTVGRFGEWEYYNMDVCMKRSKDLAEKIITKFKDKNA